MPKVKDRLAKDFVDAALELHRRRLWRDVREDGVFLIRVPTEPEPMAANVKGQFSSEFGLALARGEGAFHRLARVYLEGEVTEAFLDAGDLLSIQFEPWGEIPKQCRRLLQDAGVEARRERVVPMTIAKRPFRMARSPRRRELRTLLWVVRGVLAAHEAGELRPTGLAGPEQSWKRVLELEVRGEIARPTVATRFVPRPGGLQRAARVTLPAGLRELPRLDESWLVTCLCMITEFSAGEPARYEIVIADRNGVILIEAKTVGDELSPVVDALSKAFRGEGGVASRGLPRRIVFDTPDIQRALAPALGDVGIEAVYDELDPAFFTLIDTLTTGDTASVEPGPPETMEDWRAVDRHVMSGIELESKRERRRAVAIGRYFGSEAEGAEVFERLAHLSPYAAFIEWLAADHRDADDSPTTVEQLLEEPMDPAVRACLEARRDAVFSVFRVDSSEPGATIDVEDVLCGRRYTVHDASLSGGELDGYFLLMRLLRIGDWTLAVVAGPPLDAVDIHPALLTLEDLGVELTPEGVRRDAHLTGRLWVWTLEQDGMTQSFEDWNDPAEVHTAIFHAPSPNDVASELSRTADVDYDEGEDAWLWFRQDPSDSERYVEAGRLYFIDDRLVLEVDSMDLLQEGRKWLDELDGVTFESTSTLESAASLDDLLPDPPRHVPAVTPELERTVLEFCLRWLDESVPYLDDLTPRQACATDEGRNKVARLIRTLPVVETAKGPVDPPRDRLLGELGILSPT